MSRLPLFLLLFLLIGLLPACEVAGPGEGEVFAQSSGEKLFVTNRTSSRVYYFIVGRGTAALIFWAPHLGLDDSVDRGRTARIGHDDIYRDKTEREVIVFWWHAEGHGADRKPGEIHSFVVAL